MPKNVLVVGMARSGTSLTASIFAKNGYFLAKDESKELKEGNAFNPTGFFEAETVIDMNRDVFKAVGYQADNSWMFEPIESRHIEAIGRLSPLAGHEELVAFYNSKSPWVWKDPRLCYTLEYWWPMMDSNTAVLLVRRKPDAIYNSFLRTGWITTSSEDKRATFERIEQHIAQAVSVIERLNIPYVEIDYDDFKSSPQAVCDKLNAGFDLNITPDGLNYEDAYNHSTFMGRLSTRIDVVLNRLPKSWIHTLKRLAPSAFLRVLFPERGRR